MMIMSSQSFLLSMLCCSREIRTESEFITCSEDGCYLS